jgi:YVTN family beta-propeller protein
MVIGVWGGVGLKQRAVIFVANMGEDSITLYDSNSYELIRKFELKPAGSKLMNINYYARGPVTGPGYLYHRKTKEQLLVVNTYDDSLSIIDLNSMETVNTIFAGSHPDRIEVLEIRDRAFITNYDSDSVSVIDLQFQEIIGQIPCGIMPRSIVLDKNSNYLYIANTGSGYISVIDALSMDKLDCFKVNGYPVDICCDSAGERLYAIISFSEGLDGYNLVEYEIASGRKLNCIRLGSMPVDLLYDEKNGRLYVADGADNRLAVIDSGSFILQSKTELGRMPVSQSLGPGGKYLHVVCMMDNCLCKVNPNTGLVEKNVCTGREPACVLAVF